MEIEMVSALSGSGSSNCEDNPGFYCAAANKGEGNRLRRMVVSKRRVRDTLQCSYPVFLVVMTECRPPAHGAPGGGDAKRVLPPGMVSRG